MNVSPLHLIVCALLLLLGKPLIGQLVDGSIPVTNDPYTKYKIWYFDSTKTALYCIDCSKLKDLNPDLKSLTIVARNCRISNELSGLHELHELLIDARRYNIDTTELALPNLKNLAVFVKKQTSIPDWVTRFPNLEILALGLLDETAITKNVKKLSQVADAEFHLKRFRYFPEVLATLDSLTFLRITSWKRSTVSNLPPALGGNTQIKALSLPIELNAACLQVLSRMRGLKFLRVNAISENLDIVQIAKFLGHLEGFYVENLTGRSRLGSLKLTPPEKWKIEDGYK